MRLPKSLKKLKFSLFYLRKSILAGELKSYLYYKYIFAPKIKNWKTPIDRPSSRDDLSLHVLTCHNDLVMFLWNMYSFYRVFKNPGILYIHSDGTLTAEDEKTFKKLLPHAKVIHTADFLKEFGAKLDNYPIIKKFRTGFADYAFKVLQAKLIDPYFVSDKKYILYLDHDLLWFKAPIEIENAISFQENASYMMKSIKGNVVTLKDGRTRGGNYNSGIVLYRKENYSLANLEEYYGSIDISLSRNNRYVEQAGYAAILANLKHLPPDSYCLKGSINKMTAVKHYTSPSRHLFYLEGLNNLSKKYSI